MISVYLVHSETYYSIDGVVHYGYWLIPFYVNAFFFISGYLFFQKYFKIEFSTNMNRGGYYKVLKNTLFRLVIPTLLFSSIIYLPKIIFHSKEVSFENYFFDVFGGISYWFTSALAVSQIVFLTLLFTFKRTSIWFYTIVSMLLFAIGYYLNINRSSNVPQAFFPWFYQTGLEYTFIMSLGGIYCCYEKQIDKIMKYSSIIVVLAYIFGLSYTWESQNLKCLGLGGICNIPGFFCIICGISILLLIAKQLNSIKWISFIGRNSIVFYFFSGMYPAVLGVTAQRIFSGKSYLVTIVVAIVAVILGAITTYVVNKYLAFMTDLRKLYGKRQTRNKEN